MTSTHRLLEDTIISPIRRRG